MHVELDLQAVVFPHDAEGVETGDRRVAAQQFLDGKPMVRKALPNQEFQFNLRKARIRRNE